MPSIARPRCSQSLCCRWPTRRGICASCDCSHAHSSLTGHLEACLGPRPAGPIVCCRGRTYYTQVSTCLSLRKHLKDMSSWATFAAVFICLIAILSVCLKCQATLQTALPDARLFLPQSQCGGVDHWPFPDCNANLRCLKQNIFAKLATASSLAQILIEGLSDTRSSGFALLLPSVATGLVEAGPFCVDFLTFCIFANLQGWVWYTYGRTGAFMWMSQQLSSYTGITA